MPEAKSRCNECDTEILVVTAEQTGGLCIPCHRRANPATVEVTVTSDDEMRWRKNDAIIARLLSGCSEDEFALLRCPVCDGALSLSVHPRLHSFCVRCVSSTLHLCRHETVAAPPGWWHAHVSGGWLDSTDEKDVR
jgi:hypothetical protein